MATLNPAYFLLLGIGGFFVALALISRRRTKATDRWRQKFQHQNDTHLQVQQELQEELARVQNIAHTLGSRVELAQRRQLDQLSEDIQYWLAPAEQISADLNRRPTVMSERLEQARDLNARLKAFEGGLMRLRAP